jgi:cytochrome-b5 reductase
VDQVHYALLCLPTSASDTDAIYNYNLLPLLSAGLTPCLQVIKEVLRHGPEVDTTQVRLLYVNRAEEDILLRDLLDDLSNAHANFQVQYMLSQPSEQWQGMSGRIGMKELKQCLPGPSPDTLVYVCGPPGFMETVCGDKLPSKEQGPVSGHLQELGYTGK